MCTCTCMSVHTYTHMHAYTLHIHIQKKVRDENVSSYSQNTWHCSYFVPGALMSQFIWDNWQVTSICKKDWRKIWMVVMECIFKSCLADLLAYIKRSVVLHRQIHHLTHCFFTSTNINVYTHLSYLSANTDLTNEFNNTEKTNWIDWWLDDWFILFFLIHIHIYLLYTFTHIYLKVKYKIMCVNYTNSNKLMSVSTI